MRRKYRVKISRATWKSHFLNRTRGERRLSDTEHTIDPIQKICIVLSHPSDKNKGVARVGHPISVAIHKDRISNAWIGQIWNPPAHRDKAAMNGTQLLKA